MAGGADGRVAVIGCGPVGREVVHGFAGDGREVTVIQRSDPGSLPAGAAFAAADVMDTDALGRAVGDAGTVVLSIGLPYDGAVWDRDWPRAMASVLDVCAARGARLVFMDNLYMYGPQTAPLTEDMPLTDYGRKPRVRAAITRMWQEAHDAGRVRALAVRAPDFYGPGAHQSVLGDTTLGNLAKGKAAQFVFPPDHPHDVAHIRDIARAIVTLADAPDDVCGQAWHVPCARTRTLREHVGIAANALGVPPKISVMPQWLLPLAARFVPILGEMREMHFLFDRPYRVDASKFASRFWSDATPLEDGLAETAQAFRAG